MAQTELDSGPDDRIVQWLIMELRGLVKDPTVQISRNTGIMDALGADSLDFVEFVMHVEEEFPCSIPDEAFPTLGSRTTIVELAEAIRKSL